MTGSEISSGMVGGPGMLPIMRAHSLLLLMRNGHGASFQHYFGGAMISRPIVFMPNYFVLLTIKIENASKVCIGTRRVQQRP